MLYILLNDLFPISLLLHSAFEFIILTISVYSNSIVNNRTQDYAVLSYFVAYNLPQAIKYDNLN